MIDVKRLHRQAMELTDLALLAQRNASLDEAQAHFRLAFNLEKQAALLLKDSLEAEPTRSVLFRSAASLALDCGDHTEAEKLICMALAGNPIESIANELRDLLEQVYFRRHLDLRGIKLQEDEIQMSIAGNAIGFGVAPTAAFLHRVSSTETLLLRTAERRANKPYRTSGRYTKSLQEDVELYMSVPRAASFAVTFRVGSREQADFPGMSKGADLIRELLDCLNLYNHGEFEALHERIADEAYYNNFVGIADNLAPDGDEVNLVGFTIQKQGQTQEVAIRSRRADIRRIVDKTTEASEKKRVAEEQVIEIEGMLRFADSRKQGKDIIQIIDRGNIEHTLTVPEGFMDDIVKPLWNSKVLVRGTKKGRTILLQTIRPY